MGKNENDWKDRLGMVFSTNEDYDFDYEAEEEEETLPNKQQDLRVELDRKRRKGKTVTLVTGFVGTEEDLKQLGKELKTRCGTGGSAKEGEIIIQGDNKEKVYQYLKEASFGVKKKGG